MLRRKTPEWEHEKAADLRDWVVRDGNMAALTERLEHIESGAVTIRHNPGAPALERLFALADGIGRELTQQQSIPLSALPGRHDVER